MVDYQAVVVDLLHCLHRRGYPPTKEDITALNRFHYKAHNCRGIANVRRIVSRLHFGVQNNKPPHWVLESPNMMEIFKLVVIDCKKNFKSNDKAYQDGLTKAVRSRLVPANLSRLVKKEPEPMNRIRPVPANLPRLVKKELEPVDRSRPMPASLPHLLKREPEPVERSRLVPGSPLRLAKKELEPVDSGIPKSEELVRLKQHIRCLETKLQAKEMEIDELKTRCETRNDRLHVQSMQIQELLYTVEQKNQEIVILEDRVMTMEQMAAATHAI